MGVEVKLDLPASALQLDVAVQRGLLKAGATILELSNEKAPTEPEPKHGVHMRETGFVRADILGGEDVVIVGYEAYWAGWQESHEDWDHPHGGEAKFLERALVEGERVAMEIVAAEIRAELGE